MDLEALYNIVYIYIYVSVLEVGSGAAKFHYCPKTHSSWKSVQLDDRSPTRLFQVAVFKPRGRPVNPIADLGDLPEKKSPIQAPCDVFSKRVVGRPGWKLQAECL